MGKFKNAVTKIALGAAAIVGAGAAIASSAKKKYKESKASYEAEHANTTVKSKKATESTTFTVDDSKAKASSQTYEKSTINLKEERKRMREKQNKIYELSRIRELSGGSFGKLFFFYLVVIGAISGLMFTVGYDVLSKEDLPVTAVMVYILYTYIFILIRAGIFKSKLTKAKEKINQISERLAFLEKEKEKNNDSYYADLPGEIEIHQAVLKNMSNKYNKFINKFPNVIYKAAFSISELDPEEKQEKIVLKCTRN